MKRKRKPTGSINPGKLAEHYLKQVVEQLVAALDKGDTDTAGALFVQLSRIDDHRHILGAQVGPAIERLEATGVNFNDLPIHPTREDEAIRFQRFQIQLTNFATATIKEVTEMGPRWESVRTGNPDETFGEDMQKLGARLTCASEMLEALGILNNWIFSSPEAAWHKTLPPVKEDENPGPQFWKA